MKKREYKIYDRNSGLELESKIYNNLHEAQKSLRKLKKEIKLGENVCMSLEDFCNREYEAICTLTDRRACFEGSLRIW